ncbi:nephrin-like isoform X2 [Varroa destructor]|uniref:Nephrin n=1 Tax=Varroa destructor TaxID=109461 RepID=A0A7M7JW45_VARDE|nr:nephrin-like isoform X2 [Varroa destructor]
MRTTTTTKRAATITATVVTETTTTTTFAATSIRRKRRRRPAALVAWLLQLPILIVLASPAVAVQSFRLLPSDSEVVEGGSVILRCEVDNQEGDVQWAKDGFVLGYDRAVPGYERYSMTGKARRGEHNLLVVNATVDDDGEYQCQVAPKGNSRAIWANAKLTVLLPPKTIEIANYLNNSPVEVKQQETIQLSCLVGQSKPPAEIKWFRNNAEIHRPDMIEYKTLEGDSGRHSAVSTITLRPSPEDNGVAYACQAHHHKLKPPLTTLVRLSVLFPPDPPEILGYSEGEVLRAGNAVTLRCVSRGGNPLASVLWYRGSDTKPCDSSFSSSDRNSVNTLNFIANASDNNAIYRCVATNPVSKPETAQVKLSVHYGPYMVTVEPDGPSSAKVGDRVTMRCRTAPSNPKADISWTVDGRPVNGSKLTSRHVDGGWVTSSELSVAITKQDRQMKVFICYAVNIALGETVVQTAAIDIIYPPSPPVIYGYLESKPMKAGEQYALTCVTKGGNPAPQHAWFRGNNRVESSVKNDNLTVKSEIVFTASEKDNGRPIRCEASQKNSVPQKKSVTPKVLFGPFNVTVHQVGQLVASHNATFECRTGPSNPRPEITWWKNDKLVEAGQQEIEVSSIHGGVIIVSRLSLNPLQVNDHGATIRCQATNRALQRSEHHTVDLIVDHAPVINLRIDSLTFFEGDAALVQNLVISAYPPVTRFEWMHEGRRIPLAKEPEKYRGGPRHRITYRNDVLNFTEIHRNDSGVYILKAQNAVGWGETNFTIDVHYPASITHIDEVVYADDGSNPSLQCQVDAHPVYNDTIYWEREGFDMSRTRTTFKGRADEKTATSFLTIFNVSKADIGVFNCIANNRLVTTSAQRGAMLVVNFKPKIERHPALAKAAANETGTARLPCQANGARDVTFSWRRKNVQLQPGAKYEIIQRRLEGSFVQWESELVISDVRTSDYGNYTCVAHNDLGSDHAQVLLTTVGSPEIPGFVSLSNATYNSMTVSWQPGFSGGLAQSFKLRYRPRDKVQEGFSYREVPTPKQFNMTVSGLEMDTEYEFSLLAYNSIGESNFSEPIFERTLDEILPPSGQSLPSAISKVDIPKMIITSVSVVGTSLLFLNILLVICFVRKKKGKRQKDEEESEHSATKPAAIEMYAPPPSYTNATVAETVSSTSDKSDTAHFSCSDDSTSKPSFILEGTSLPANTVETNLHYQPAAHSTLPTFHHPDDSSLVTGGAKPQVAASGTDRHATLPARHHHHRVHYAPEVQRRLSEAEYPYFRAGSGPPTPPGRTSASANGVGSAPPGVVGPVAPAGAVGVSLRGDMYNVGYISYPHAELTSFNSNPLATATQRISEHDGHLV